ncbi:MAG TPA: cupin domain-containing protein [Telluria sp.]|nr:cupin domain-containing protein [Telluria sp.]
MAGYCINIEGKALSNDNYREVLYTTQRSQLVVMALRPGEETGMASHDDIDQFIHVEGGEGELILDGKEYRLKDGIAALIPARTEHHIKNTSNVETLRFTTLYSPPKYPDGTIHRTKAEADGN